jgi:hypothetical protein
MAKEREVLTTDLVKFVIGARLLSPCLGTAPADPEIYKKFLIDTALEGELAIAKTDQDRERIEQVRDAMIHHELGSLPGAQGAILANTPQEVQDVLKAEGEVAEGVRGLTVFRRHDHDVEPRRVPALAGHMLRGNMKEAVENNTNIPQPASKVDKYIYVGEFLVEFHRDGKPLSDVDGIWSRPLRTRDMRTQQSRVCIATSEFINPLGATTIEFTIFCLAKAFSKSFGAGGLDVKDIERIVNMGLTFSGVGQFRNGSHGLFEVTSFAQSDMNWHEAVKARLEMLKMGQQLYTGAIVKAAK